MEYFSNWCNYIRLTYLRTFIQSESGCSAENTTACKQRATALSVSEFVVRTNAIFKKFVMSFKKEPCESRILVPDKNIALRGTFIIIRFPDVYDVDS